MTQPPIVPGPYNPQQGWDPPPGPYTLANSLPVAPPRPRSPRWVLPLVVFLVIMVVGLGVLLLYPVLRPAAHSTPLDAPTTTHPPATTEASAPLGIITGAFALFDKSKGWKDSDTCTGSGGFSDIKTGAQIKVTGPTGETLGLGELLPGGTAHKLGTKVACVWFIHIGGVPTGKGFYGIEITHRGVVQYAEKDLFGPGAELTLTLGDEG